MDFESLLKKLNFSHFFFSKLYGSIEVFHSLKNYFYLSYLLTCYPFLAFAGPNLPNNLQNLQNLLAG